MRKIIYLMLTIGMFSPMVAFCRLPLVTHSQLPIKQIHNTQIAVQNNLSQQKFDAYMKKVQTYKCAKTQITQENEIKRLFKTDEANNAILGLILAKAVRCYTSNKDIARVNKLDFFWDLMMYYQHKPIKCSVAADLLRNLKPHEIGGKITAFYKDHPNNKCVSMLLGTITATKEGMAILKQEIYKSNDPAKVKRAAFYFVASAKLTPKEGYRILQGAVQRIRKLSPSYLDKQFNYAAYYSQLVHFAIRGEQSLIPGLLVQVDREPQYLKNIFNLVLCRAIVRTQLLKVDKNNRGLLKRYLKSQEKEAGNMSFGLRTPEPTGKTIKHTTSMANVSFIGSAMSSWRWLHAYAVVNILPGREQYVEQARFMARYLLKMPNKIQQANLIGVVDQSAIQSIPTRNLKILQAKLFLAKETGNKFQNRYRYVAMRALMKLNKELAVRQKSGGVMRCNVMGLIPRSMR